jgi:hypothetical protein
MPLETYADLRPWNRSIREEILERRMPPWPAVVGVRRGRLRSSHRGLMVERRGAMPPICHPENLVRPGRMVNPI